MSVEAAPGGDLGMEGGVLWQYWEKAAGNVHRGSCRRLSLKWGWMWWDLTGKGVEICEPRQDGREGFSGWLFYSEVVSLHECWEGLEGVVVSPGAPLLSR